MVPIIRGCIEVDPLSWITVCTKIDRDAVAWKPRALVPLHSMSRTGYCWLNLSGLRTLVDPEAPFTCAVALLPAHGKTSSTKC